MQEKDIEIAGLKDERDCGFVKVDELERALRPFQHLEFEQTWGGTVRISWCLEYVIPIFNFPNYVLFILAPKAMVNNEELFNQVINE